jgi:hypothetical protein
VLKLKVKGVFTHWKSLSKNFMVIYKAKLLRKALKVLFKYSRNAKRNKDLKEKRKQNHLMSKLGSSNMTCYDLGSVLQEANRQA